MWLDCRILFIQAIAFAMLYALVMLVLGQQAPWLILSAVSAAALCALFLCAMVLRSPYSYTEKKPNPAR